MSSEWNGFSENCYMLLSTFHKAAIEASDLAKPSLYLGKMEVEEMAFVDKTIATKIS